MPEQEMDKQQKPHEPTPRDDTKKMVSEILKRVDQMIRTDNLDLARLEIKKAKAVDPRNVYALALEERISVLEAEIVHMVEIRHNNISIEHQQMPVSLEPIAAISSPVLPSADPASIPSQLSPSPATSLQEKGEDRIFDRSTNLKSYRQALTHAWSDGALTENEEQQLNELRAVFGVTKKEHEKMEKDVKYECYRNALLIQQLSGNSTKTQDSNSITDLQCAYQISGGEHLLIQAQLMNTIKDNQRDKLLVIDDDSKLLELLSDVLESNGFDVTSLSTSDEAYVLLRKFVPDLILCDINLETSTMGGFTFYEKIKELKNVERIPFIFLTGLTDEALVRTGKELGVDDYLMKPISEQTLVSTLRGKLKRFKQLSKVVPAPLAA